MRKLLTSAILAAASVIAVEAQTVNGPVIPKSQAEARAKAERMRRRTGGFVFDHREARGTFLFANAQESVPMKELEMQAKQLERDCMINIKVVSSAGVEMESAGEVMKKLGALAAVFIIDDRSKPITLSVAPEQKFAILNIGPLSADKPAADTLGFRVRKEMTRAMAMVFGTGYTFSSGGVVSPAFSLEDIDSLPLGVLPIETSNMITVMANKFGFVPFKRALYSQALRDGWAPPPVGEFQKALWEQYHAKTTEPLRIEYDKKKGE